MGIPIFDDAEDRGAAPQKADAVPPSSPSRKDPKPTTSERRDLWDACKADYRAGVSLGKLAETYPFTALEIVRRKQREKWRRDLGNDVRTETVNRLAADAVPADSRDSASEEDIVAAAAARAAGVAHRQMDTLAPVIESVKTAAEALNRCLKAHEAGSPLDAQDAAYLHKGAIASAPYAILQLSNALARIIPQERAVYGLDKQQDARSYDDQLKDWLARAEAERAAQAARVDTPEGDAPPTEAEASDATQTRH